MKGVVLNFLIIVLLLLVACSAPKSATTQMTKTRIYTSGKIEVRGSGEPIELINNPNATNPTFAELVAFIKRNQTDKYPYILGPPKNAFVCTDFAETVHNNAEAAGIRAAWVGIDIEGKAEGHELNAFETKDLGLVYIDCTGKGLWDESSNISNWDRRAYVEKGQPYATKYLIYGPAQHIGFSTYTGQFANRLGLPDFIKLEDQTLSILENMGWIWKGYSKEVDAKNRELSEWSKKHDIEELSMQWIQEWIQKHEAELCGREFVINKSSASWNISTESMTGHWFQPEKAIWFGLIEEKVIKIDGIPIVWQVRWSMNGWDKPFQIWKLNQLVAMGAVKDIHLNW